MKHIIKVVLLLAVFTPFLASAKTPEFRVSPKKPVPVVIAAPTCTLTDSTSESNGTRWVELSWNSTNATQMSPLYITSTTLRATASGIVPYPHSSVYGVAGMVEPGYVGTSTLDHGTFPQTFGVGFVSSEYTETFTGKGGSVTCTDTVMN